MSAAQIVSRTDQHFTVQVTIPYESSMLGFEERIQTAVNQVGVRATEEALGQFDSDGSPIAYGVTRFFSKGQEPKEYQTPYGPVIVNRHVYQTSRGGKTFCPLENDARIIITSTPKFAKTIAAKYADMGGSRVKVDLSENHGRSVARSFIQNVSEAVSAIIEAKQDKWTYQEPKLNSPVHSVGVGMDGTTLLMCEDGYREAMVGTVALYDKEGQRLHTTYLAASPEYGKQTFLDKLKHEIDQVKSRYSSAITVGIADGAKCNWEFLNERTSIQTLDFWHVTEYLANAASVMFKGKSRNGKKGKWLDSACHKLKHFKSSPTRLLKEMQEFYDNNNLSIDDSKKLLSAITYFKNNKSKMTYSSNISKNLPIGSGVTEAACKVIVKQRLCGSAMKWKDKGAATVLRLRCLNYSVGQWQQFWSKVSQHGLPINI